MRARASGPARFILAAGSRLSCGRAYATTIRVEHGCLARGRQLQRLVSFLCVCEPGPLVVGF
jgi:hypothetical protein